jgi:hypothetical protein
MSTAPPLNKFSASIRATNIARPYLFYVELTLPPGLLNSGKVSAPDVDTINLFCHGAQTPFTQMMTNDNYFEAGIKRKFIHDYDYQDLMLQFYVDQTYLVQKFFEKWKELIVNSRRNFSYPDDYTAESFKLNMIDLEGNSNFSYTYKRVVPKVINSIMLDYSSTGIMSLPVSFVFETVETSIDTASEDTYATTQSDKIKGAYTNSEVYQGLQSDLNKQSIISGLGTDFAIGS